MKFDVGWLLDKGDSGLFSACGMHDVLVEAGQLSEPTNRMHAFPLLSATIKSGFSVEEASTLDCESRQSHSEHGSSALSFLYRSCPADECNEIEFLCIVHAAGGVCIGTM